MGSQGSKAALKLKVRMHTNAEHNSGLFFKLLSAFK